MKHSSPLSQAVLVALGLLAMAPVAAQEHLELGKMWTFENPPLAYLKQEYGFKPDQKWLNSLRMASLRFGSWCSASFVSPKGLIMTNNHCARDNVAKVSPPGVDWVENGFYARSLADEIKLDGLTVQQLVSMTDVTEEMNEGAATEESDEAIASKRKTNEKRILDRAKKEHPDRMAQVVKIHHGAVFELYLYKVYDDIRLVCSPHLQTAHFGGDPDNFTYPRYCIDFTFCRAYEDGQPADTSKFYFRWKQGGPKKNELVFVTGNPGSTGRLLTLAQMEHLRDVEYPIQIDQLDHQLEVLRRFAASDPRLGRALRQNILSAENSQKAIRGYESGLLDPHLMQEKRKAEEAFRAKVNADPELQQKFGKVWDRLADVAREKNELEPKLAFQNPSYSFTLAHALAIVRAVEPEASKKEREVAGRQARRPVRRGHPFYTALFVDHLARARRWLGADDPYVRAVLGEDKPAVAARRLASSQVRDPAFVKQLLEGGKKAVDASDDPAIVAARAIGRLGPANETVSKKLDAEEAVQSSLLGRALFACYGDKISPDATMTLRFSDGIVEGYPYNGTIAPYRTTFYGLYGRNIEFNGKHPFEMPKIWLDRRERVDMSRGVNFVSTNDIIGGNSGSPVVNKKLEVVGLIFDGNIEQLPNRFLFRDDTQRSVSVHVDAIMEALTKIYEAKRVVKELLGT